MSQVRPSSILNTHSESIQASPERLWALFLDRAAWMESFQSRTLLSPEDHRVGTRAEIRTDIPSSPVRVEEILHIEPARRLVVRITVDDAPFLAHADFQFEPAAAGCSLQISIHTVLLEASAEEVTALREATQRKLAHDFARLRQRAESAIVSSTSDSSQLSN